MRHHKLFKMATSITSMNPKDREKFFDELEFPFCDEVNKYEKMAKIGQGTFGEVFKARHKKTKKIVALKKVLMENEKEGVNGFTTFECVLYSWLSCCIRVPVPYHSLKRNQNTPASQA